MDANNAPQIRIAKTDLSAASLLSTVSLVRELSKSGIVALVLISVLGGYLIGQSPDVPFDLGRMALTLIGILFLASGSSALNQLQERDIDARMPRTAKRPLPSGRISVEAVAAFVALTLGVGLFILTRLSPVLAALGVLAVVSYNGFYTLWWKKHWAYAAVPGAIPGALPILMGHLASNGHPLSPAGIYLFFILFFWQMPHFWALALRFREDYRLGDFPTLPVARGNGVTVHQIVLWCLAYLALALMGPLFMKIGAIYLIPTLVMSAKVLWELRRFVLEQNEAGEDLSYKSKRWIHFFLWINFSLIVYVFAAAADLWSVNLLAPWIVRF